MVNSTDVVVVVGGCGRVGLPLGLAFASRGCSVVLYDIDADAVERVNAGRMPFAEDGAEPVLAEVSRTGLLRATPAAACVSLAEHLVVVVGTPVDEHLNPDLSVVPRALERCAAHLRDGQLIVLPSTVYPGVTGRLQVAEIPTIWLDRQLGTSHFDLGRFLPGYLRWYLYAYGPRRRSRRLPTLARTGAAHRG